MNIVVLAGGTSTEREISIVSGTQVTKALRSLGHHAILTGVFFGDSRIDPAHIEEAFAVPTALDSADGTDAYDVDGAAAYIRSFDDRLEEETAKSRPFFGPNVLALCEAADTVFLALHGSNGEDGRLQAAFDMLNIRYTGAGYLGSALAMDKEMAKVMFRADGVPTPAGIVVRRGQAVLTSSENGVGLPCVVKPARGGSSVGVSVAYTEEEYAAAVAEGFRYEDVLIVERFVKGREFSVGVVDGEAYPIIEIAPLQGFYDYTNKYKAGSTIETCPADLPADLTERMQQIALDAFHTLQLENYARIDVMMNEENEMFVLEANTLPGMTPTSLLPQEAAALGIDFAHLCEKLINVSVR